MDWYCTNPIMSPYNLVPPADLLSSGLTVATLQFLKQRIENNRRNIYALWGLNTVFPIQTKTYAKENIADTPMSHKPLIAQRYQYEKIRGTI